MPLPQNQDFSDLEVNANQKFFDSLAQNMPFGAIFFASHALSKGIFIPYRGLPAEPKSDPVVWVLPTFRTNTRLFVAELVGIEQLPYLLMLTGAILSPRISEE